MEPDSDLDLSFTSIASSATFASTSSARSSLSLPFDPRFSTSSFSSFAAAAAPSAPSSSSSLLQPRPHSRSDPHWSAVRAAAALSPDGSLHLHHLQVLRQLGSGHHARVFHCRLADHPASPDFALKVVDVDTLARAKNAAERLAHVRAEARVLAAVDHPFLPTLYARLEAPPRYTCFLLDYCPGGDLHSLLRLQPGGRLPLEAARFVAAEVLLALEYLHAAGFVYRDLKPENILRRGDGHVVLSDFDLCLQSDVTPALHRRTRHASSPSRRASRQKQRHACCCFGGPGHCDSDGEEATTTEFVAEPEASSKECVGTHEYLAPEVAAGEVHGAAVDWWALGIFIYELLYGRTPFKGGSKEATLRNIRTRPLRFPDSVGADGYALAQDLIEKLLVRDPRRRLGGARGASEVKRHSFFQDIDWPLVLSCTPPGLGPGAEGDRRPRSIRDRRRRCRRVWPWKLWRGAASGGTHHHKTANDTCDVINNHNGEISGANMVIGSGSKQYKRASSTTSSMNGWFD
ncbi:hypothetical protein Taro_004581 [Colocasia esculenta]|uniref:non-specific serine/threonine protein kinase n=1 Tax=Colocasia esculenta TaxID=4460 RepID=A0A843TVD4_COLES|nr:hypothetical protein [Colocasia esculenta]